MPSHPLAALACLSEELRLYSHGSKKQALNTTVGLDDLRGRFQP